MIVNSSKSFSVSSHVHFLLSMLTATILVQDSFTSYLVNARGLTWVSVPRAALFQPAHTASPSE